MSAAPKPEIMHYRFTVEKYDEMIARGILTSDDRVELLAGEIVEMSPIGSRHMGCINRLAHFFITALGERAVVAIQGPIVLPPHSEPEPDVAVLRPRDDFYASAHAQPAEILLLIEVADSSLMLDRNVKLPLYAAAGIAEVWVIDLLSNAIEVYTEPVDRYYRTMQVFRSDDVLALAVFPGVRVKASELLV